MKKIKLNPKKLRKLEPAQDLFFSLLRSIIFQQLSGKAASAILERFVLLFPKKNSLKPKTVLILSDTEFKSAGISSQKMIYIRDLATKFSDGSIVIRKICSMRDEEIIEQLIMIRGVGEWTAHMFLIFALNRPDVLPTGDLMIRRGFKKVFNLRKEPTHEKMVSLAKPYQGKRTYLSLYLWSIMDAEKAKK